MTRLPVFLAMALASVPARADEVTIAIGHALPPYVIVEESRGLEYDIVREALALEGHTMKPRFMTSARVAREMEAGLVDGAMTMRPGMGIAAFYSDSHVVYRNYAITLADKGPAIRGLQDLSDKAVLGFRDATGFLGPEYKAVVEHNPHYREDDKQVLQPLLLFLDRTQVVISDRYVFSWFANTAEVKAKADTRQKLNFQPLFPPTEHYVAFVREDLRNSFNRGLRRLRDSGGYDRIVARYSGFLKDATP